MGGDCMKDVLAAIADEVENPDVRRNRGREYLQARMLRVLQVEHAGIVLAFMGGTALRSNARSSVRGTAPASRSSSELPSPSFRSTSTACPRPLVSARSTTRRS